MPGLVLIDPREHDRIFWSFSLIPLRQSATLQQFQHRKIGSDRSARGEGSFSLFKEAVLAPVQPQTAKAPWLLSRSVDRLRSCGVSRASHQSLSERSEGGRGQSKAPPRMRV